MQAQMTRTAKMPLAEAAQLLRLRYNAALNAVLVGELEGHRKDNGRWEVSEESVRAYRARRAVTHTRPGAA